MGIVDSGAAGMVRGLGKLATHGDYLGLRRSDAKASGDHPNSDLSMN